MHVRMRAPGQTKSLPRACITPVTSRRPKKKRMLCSLKSAARSTSRLPTPARSSTYTLRHCTFYFRRGQWRRTWGQCGPARMKRLCTLVSCLKIRSICHFRLILTWLGLRLRAFSGDARFAEPVLPSDGSKDTKSTKKCLRIHQADCQVRTPVA